ncbi:MAG: zinc-dependent metalloprotease [Acidobacteria bacterium]|nr:zinc-dependent metalloprotease [Acidobacteriota bacterium]
MIGSTARTVAVLLAGSLLPALPGAAGEPFPLPGAFPAVEQAEPEGGTPAPKRSRRKPKGKAGKEAPEEKKKEEKPFDEVVKDTEKVEGLFTFYLNREEGKFLLEVRPDQLDRTYLLSPTLESGVGEKSISLVAAGVFPNYPVQFRKVGKNLQFVIPNIWFRADRSPEMDRAVARAFSDSLLAQVKLASQPHPERHSHLVDLSSLFLQDLEGLQPFLKEVYETPYAFEKEASHFGGLKAFPKNVEIEAVRHYKTGEPKGSFTLPDPRSLFLRFRYSLAELPETGYRPRIADDRVGHFATIFQDYSTDRTETPYVRYVERWHLEKQDPAAAISPPKEPILFWLENTIPTEYRDAIREGTLAWNQAFERIGFRDAIVVNQQPDDADWDPADTRYNTLRWIVAPGFGFAQGPSRANPFTGQLFDADIRFSADMVRYAWAEYEEMVDPVSLIEPPAPIWPATGARNLCDYARGAALEAAFGMHLLAARGVFGEDSPAAKRYVHDFLVHVTLHEVGHTLGLRHNFKASIIHPVSRLHDAALTAARGLTGSVMDYIPVNVAPDGQAQGEYWQTTPGPYDYWAIEYAYRPIEATGPEAEAAELERIAGRVADAELAYATDEDTFGFSPRSVDPTANLWDIGDDPIQFYRGRVDLARELWDRMEERFEKPGNRYQKFLRVFNEGVTQYLVAALNAPKFIGGIYNFRDHVGDPGGRVPFQPVPAEKQREALEFVRTAILAPDALDFPPEILNRLVPERHWDFQGTPWNLQRLDYPIHTLVAALQAQVLNRLYHPITMSRIVDLELKSANGTDPLTLAEVFSGLRSSVWTELTSGEEIRSFRRNLQRSHLDTLIKILIAPAPGTPEDARTLARADLIDIGREAERALGRTGLDRITRAHLEESRARVDAALGAGLERSLPSGPVTAG